MTSDTKKKFTDCISNIIKRPGMYLVNRVEDFELIFLGYSFGVKYSIDDVGISDFIDNFKIFVNNWADSSTDQGWSKLIRFYSSTDYHSIEIFSKLFNEFIETEGKR